MTLVAVVAVLVVVHNKMRTLVALVVAPVADVAALNYLATRS